MARASNETLEVAKVVRWLVEVILRFPRFTDEVPKAVTCEVASMLNAPKVIVA
jgi:hypothetical protein